ncbi:MAG: hypothetical protein JF612_09485 [Planctomycetia bacterium]|nr:hypothetical protein [Planctomycetia bacterium]
MASVIAAAALSLASAAEPIAPLLKVAPGFAVEPVYVVPRDSQGSWISLCADSHGSLYASDQYGPLYQISIAADGAIAAQPLKLPIGGVHGMTWIGDELYAVVGQREICQPGLYRLRDTDRDGQLDSVQQLNALGGDGEHGPHAVVSSSDGKSLLVIAGNATPLPSLARSRVPRWRDDSLLPPLPALIGSETRGLPHGGWICRTDREGRDWELICMGLRNAYALARDEAGELFTFDSDTEHCRPASHGRRVSHAISPGPLGRRLDVRPIARRASRATWRGLHGPQRGDCFRHTAADYRRLHQPKGPRALLCDRRPEDPVGSLSLDLAGARFEDR